MKKAKIKAIFFFLTFSISLVFILSGCSNKSEETEEVKRIKSKLDLAAQLIIRAPDSAFWAYNEILTTEKN